MNARTPISVWVFLGPRHLVRIMIAVGPPPQITLCGILRCRSTRDQKNWWLWAAFVTVLSSVDNSVGVDETGEWFHKL